MAKKPKLNVVSISAPNTAAVTLLTLLLERAKAGEIQGFVFCADVTGGYSEIGYIPMRDRLTVVAMLEKTKYRILRDMEEDAEPVWHEE